MRLFPPKHTFHNFQLIELLRLRFVRLSPAAPTTPPLPPSAMGTRSLSSMRKFMNIFCKMNSASGGAYPVCSLVDCLHFSLHIHRIFAVLVHPLMEYFAGLLITVARPRSMAIYIILIFTRRPCGASKSRKTVARQCFYLMIDCYLLT